MHAVVRILFQETKASPPKTFLSGTHKMSSAVWLGSFSSCVAHDLPLPPTSSSVARELVDEEIAEMDGYFLFLRGKFLGGNEGTCEPRRLAMMGSERNIGI